MEFTKAQNGAWLSRGMLAMCELDAMLNDYEYIGALANKSKWLPGLYYRGLVAYSDYSQTDRDA